MVHILSLSMWAADLNSPLNRLGPLFHPHQTALLSNPTGLQANRFSVYGYKLVVQNWLSILIIEKAAFSESTRGDKIVRLSFFKLARLIKLN